MHVVGMQNMDVAESEALRIRVGKMKRAWIHVDRPYLGGGRQRRERESDRTPPASDVEKCPTRRWRWSEVEEHRRAAVEPSVTEHTAVGCGSQSGAVHGPGDFAWIGSEAIEIVVIDVEVMARAVVGGVVGRAVGHHG